MGGHPRYLSGVPAYLRSEPSFAIIFETLNKKDPFTNPLPKTSIWNQLIELNTDELKDNHPSLCILNAMGWLAHSLESRAYMQQPQATRIELYSDIEKALQHAIKLIKRAELDMKVSVYKMGEHTGEFMWNMESVPTELFIPQAAPIPFSELIKKYQEKIKPRLIHERISTSKGKGKRASIIRFVKRFHLIALSHSHRHNYPLICKLVELLFDETVSNQQVRDWVKVRETKPKNKLYPHQK